MKTACRHFREVWMDRKGRLPDDDTGIALRAHSSGCPSCTAFLEENRDVFSVLNFLAVERSRAVPSADLADRIVARVQREAVESSAPRTVPFFLRSSTRRYAPLAAGFAVFLAFGVFAALVGGGILPSGNPSGYIAPTQSQTDTKGATNDPNGISPGVGADAITDMTGFAPESCSTPRLVVSIADPGSLSFLKAGSAVQTTYATLVDSREMDEAKVFRAYLNSDDSITICLLLPSDTIQDRADRIAKVVSSCASPFRIEIIDAEDIGDRLKTLGLVDAEAFVSGSADGGFRLLMLDLGR